MNTNTNSRISLNMNMNNNSNNDINSEDTKYSRISNGSNINIDSNIKLS